MNDNKEIDAFFFFTFGISSKKIAPGEYHVEGFVEAPILSMSSIHICLS